MEIEQLRDYCLSKAGVSEHFPFGDPYLVFKVMDKMFLLVSVDEPEILSLKCDPAYAIELRADYEGIVGAFHFNKTHWNNVHCRSDVPKALVWQLIDHSYNEVAKKLPRRLQQELQSLCDSSE